MDTQSSCTAAQYSMYSSCCHTLLAQALDVLSSLGGALLCCCLLTQIVQHLGLYCLYTHAYIQTMPGQDIQPVAGFILLVCPHYTVRVGKCTARQL